MLGAAAAAEPGGLSPRLSSRRDSVPEAAWRQGLRPEEPSRGATPRSSRRKDPVLHQDLRDGTTSLLAGGRGRLGKAASQPVLRTVAVKPQRPAPPPRELPDLLGDDAQPTTGREPSGRPLSAADAGDESNGAPLGGSGAPRGEPRRCSHPAADARGLRTLRAARARVASEPRRNGAQHDLQVAGLPLVLLSVRHAGLLA